MIYILSDVQHRLVHAIAGNCEQKACNYPACLANYREAGFRPPAKRRENECEQLGQREEYRGKHECKPIPASVCFCVEPDGKEHCQQEGKRGNNVHCKRKDEEHFKFHFLTRILFAAVRYLNVITLRLH